MYPEQLPEGNSRGSTNLIGVETSGMGTPIGIEEMVEFSSLNWSKGEYGLEPPCAGMDVLFFAESKRAANTAARICIDGACKVMQECQDRALEKPRKYGYGVWGSLTRVDRERLKETPKKIEKGVATEKEVLLYNETRGKIISQKYREEYPPL